MSLEHLKLNGFVKRKFEQLPESEHFTFKVIRGEHAEKMFELNADPEVVRYTGDGAFGSVQEARQFIENYSAYDDYGIGRWLLTHKKSNEIVGWCGLKYNKEADEVDLGYRLFKKFWNKGFATEAAQTCLRFGHEVLNIPIIVGRAMPANVASVKVLEKIGMTYQGRQIEHDGEEVVVYASFISVDDQNR